MTARTDAYIIEAGLEAADDPKGERPVYRRVGFDGISTPKAMDEAIAGSLRRFRIEKDLSRAELALLLGSIEAVYGRYERAVTKLHATQVLHLCEVLGIYPDDLLFEAAPHLWGTTEEEAHERRRVTKMVQALPPETLRTVGTLLDAIFALQKSPETSSPPL
ncbi:helix-turn-helix transcriptional regulator [Rhizobium sp. P32RR-XVIII]|uniref:helix-turn-helix domain-containing protein n=1 Tax=Rhizobium sp. P32RR-XVIII TaxID=2726738 RepID=UPI001456A138|nr:helix-turn-helix transcriptional regulator [Rhizobium sp. P32RR-XVIII]NLS08288.1 helix-turn-helix transcriptional regulator [Rhizobium sp. P32RR-XVIII]